MNLLLLRNSRLPHRLQIIEIIRKYTAHLLFSVALPLLFPRVYLTMTRKNTHAANPSADCNAYTGTKLHSSCLQSISIRIRTHLVLSANMVYAIFLFYTNPNDSIQRSFLQSFFGILYCLEDRMMFGYTTYNLVPAEYLGR